MCDFILHANTEHQSWPAKHCWLRGSDRAPDRKNFPVDEMIEYRLSDPVNSICVPTIQSTSDRKVRLGCWMTDHRCPANFFSIVHVLTTLVFGSLKRLTARCECMQERDRASKLTRVRKGLERLNLKHDALPLRVKRQAHNG